MELERDPPPGEGLSPIDADHVWLFHGTAPEDAIGIRDNGWNPPDPAAEVPGTAFAAGIPETLLRDDYAGFRFERNLASCSTGWRQAASYARRGAEFRYYRQRAVGMATLGEPTYETAEGGVILLAVPWTALSGVADRPDRVAFLPDGSDWISADADYVVRRAPREVLVPGSMLTLYAVGIDRVAATCTCASGIWWGREPVLDPRGRCSKCHLGNVE